MLEGVGNGFDAGKQKYFCLLVFVIIHEIFKIIVAQMLKGALYISPRILKI